MTPLFYPAFLLILCSLLLFRLLPRRLGISFLAAAGFAVMGALNPYSLLALFIVTLLTYFTGRRLAEQNISTHHIQLFFAVVIALVWCTCTGIHIYNSVTGHSNPFFLPAGLPVAQLLAFRTDRIIFYGLTFYCCRAVFYVVDVSSKKMFSRKKLLEIFSLYEFYSLACLWTLLISKHFFYAN